MDRKQLEPYCVIAKWEGARLHTDKVPESCILTAVKLGWAVVGRDSDVVPVVAAPTRDSDPGDERPPDYGEA